MENIGAVNAVPFAAARPASLARLNNTAAKLYKFGFDVRCVKLLKYLIIIIAVFPSRRALPFIPNTFIMGSSVLSIPIMLFVTVKSVNALHFVLGQLEIIQLRVFLNMVGVA